MALVRLWVNALLQTLLNLVDRKLHSPMREVQDEKKPKLGKRKNWRF